MFGFAAQEDKNMVTDGAGVCQDFVRSLEEPLLRRPGEIQERDAKPATRAPFNRNHAAVALRIKPCRSPGLGG